MTDRSYTIGQVSRMTGVSARRIRFYSDKGLLPPYSRTEAGYRVFSDDDIGRLELITALRETEASLATIGSVLAKRATLTEVLTGQLDEVEHRIAAQRRIASALRTALQSSEPSVRDLKRVATMIDIAHSERRAVAKAFFDDVVEGLNLDSRWKLRMIESGTPELPENPTTAQIEAWMELAELFQSEDFRASMRLRAEDTAITGMRYGGSVLDPYFVKWAEIMNRVRAAMDAGADPNSAEASEVAEAQIALRAEAYPDGMDHRESLRRLYETQRPFLRFYELLTVLRERPDFMTAETSWLETAIRHRLGVN